MAEGGEVEAPGGGAADEAGSAQIHVPDGGGHFLRGVQIQEGEVVGQEGLIDDANASGGLEPDGAVMLAVDVHGGVFAEIGASVKPRGNLELTD